MGIEGGEKVMKFFRFYSNDDIDTKASKNVLYRKVSLKEDLFHVIGSEGE